LAFFATVLASIFSAGVPPASQVRLQHYIIIAISYRHAPSYIITCHCFDAIISSLIIIFIIIISLLIDYSL